MVLSDTSIRRPVLATVVSAVLLIFGLFAFDRLTVREYPDIDRPVISIGTTYRGASAPIIETQVTQVIEDAVAGISGIDTITSTSREGSSSVNIEFEAARDIDGATNDVRDRIARAVGWLPEEAERSRVAKSDSDARSMIRIAVTAENMGGLALTDFAERFLADRFSAVPGVARVMVGGGRRTAMRIWFDPMALAARWLTVQDVETALRRQNVELPSGRVESVSRDIAVRTDSALATADEFRALIVKVKAGRLVRLGELAEVTVGAEDERSEFRVNGRTAVGIGVVKQSTANTLEVADGVAAEVAALRESVPLGVTLDVSFDRSVFIRQSIEEVFVALGISLALVVGVIFVFLRSVPATAIPAVAIPISVIASFTVMAALGF
jgi:multidrug efflux pump